MWSRAVFVLITCLLIWVPAGVTATLSAEQQVARERGIALFNQYRVSSQHLIIAAEAGDADSQFYLAEELRQLDRFMTREAQQWLEAAAGQGHIYAMIRLAGSEANLCSVAATCPEGSRTPGEWYQKANDVILPLAEQGDPEAMFQMYKLTREAEWRARAAEAGHAEAQYWIAFYIEEGAGTYWWPSSRQKEVEKWFKASAEGGYPAGMMQYAGFLSKRGDEAGYRYWVEKAARTGNASGLYNYAMLFIRGEEQDLIKGYGLMSLFLEMDGGGYPNKTVAERRLRPIASQMTPQQIEKALEFAQEWKASHPPLSYFPHILYALDK